MFPGDTMAFDARVTDVGTDDTGCGWVSLAIALTVAGEVKTTCTARVALPADARRQPLGPLRRPVAAVTRSPSRLDASPPPGGEPAPKITSPARSVRPKEH